LLKSNISGRGALYLVLKQLFSGRTLLNSIRCLKKWNYAVHIYFLWLSEVDIALDRVRIRVMRGGHNIPEDVIRRRFERSIRNFLTTYRSLADSWTFFDNSGEIPELIASEDDGKLGIIMTIRYQDLVARHGGK
jgi:predicted ABC-type ATPase